MLPVKQNLSSPAAGMSFRVVAANGIARVEWESGVVDINVNDILGDAGVAREGGALAEAREWLYGVLADGPVGAKNIQSEARAAGIPWITVRRAAEAIRVTRRKSSFGGGWEWRLREHAHDEDAQPTPSQMSAFEQPTENAMVSEKRVIEDAHCPNLSNFGEFNDEDEVRL
jgi:putative DNA primase/helicase